MKENKPYTTKIANGQITLTLKEKREGRQVSIVATYPMYERKYNEEKERFEIVRLKKSQAEQSLYDSLLNA